MPAPMAELSVEALDRALRVNVRGFFLAMKRFRDMVTRFWNNTLLDDADPGERYCFDGNWF